MVGVGAQELVVMTYPVQMCPRVIQRSLMRLWTCGRQGK